MYFFKKINYKQSFKKIIFLFLIFFFMNNLISLKAEEGTYFGDSKKNNNKLKAFLYKNENKYSLYDNVDSQFNMFFGYKSHSSGNSLYPDLSIIYYSENVREFYERMLFDMTKNKKIYKMIK